MYVETRQTPACYGSVAVPRRKPEKGAQRPCDGAVSGAGLDTLAQPCQTTRENLQKRARAKHLTVPLAIRLAELRSPLEKSYRNAAYCAGTLRQKDGKLQGRYCGTRWCLVCSRVRTARAITRYQPVLAQWEDPMFVTLTVRNVAGDLLTGLVGEMLHKFAAVRRAITRTDKLSFEAVRKIECTHNYHQDTYHPHFHMVVNGRAAAEALRTRWVATWGDRAELVAQDVRPCTPGSLLELFKYATKLATNAGGGEKRYMSPEALDVIFQSLRGRRIWQPVGFVAPATTDEEAEIGTTGTTEAPDATANGTEWEWLQDQHDWVDTTTGELLTEYTPNRAAESFVRHYGTITPTDTYGNQGQAVTAQTSTRETGAAPTRGTGTGRPCQPTRIGRRPERATGDPNGRAHSRNHGRIGGAGDQPGGTRADAAGGYALEPGSGIVRGRLGSGINGPKCMI